MLRLSVTGEAGYIFYNKNGTGFPEADGGVPSGGGGGGICGGGSIWSSCEQVIWVSAGGVRYPIWLEPGWNDIWFWIPSIFPDDTWIDAPLVIEAPGYILIPGGFEWNVITGIGAPPEPGIIRIIDKVFIKDELYISFREPDLPDNPVIVDTVNIHDELMITMRQGGHITIAIEDQVDVNESIGFNDDGKPDINTFFSDQVEIIDSYNITVRVPPISGDPKINDVINIKDELFITSREGFRTFSSMSDIIDIKDSLIVELYESE